MKTIPGFHPSGALRASKFAPGEIVERGRDSIDHSPGGHDDRANVIAGLIGVTKKPSYDLELFINGYRSDDEYKRSTHTQRRSAIEAIRHAGIPLYS